MVCRCFVLLQLFEKVFEHMCYTCCSNLAAQRLFTPSLPFERPGSAMTLEDAIGLESSIDQVEKR